MSNRAFTITVTIILIITILPIIVVIMWDDSGKYTVPNLELSLSTEEPDQKEITIRAIASTTDKKGISSITLPDGTVENTNSTTFTVNENGEYAFEVQANNGEIVNKKIEVTNILEFSAYNPYIPAGFAYLEGNPDKGYTIRDNFENEYVWVPVETGELVGINEENNPYTEEEDDIKEFINSVKKYCGFYIGRYETSIYRNDVIAEHYVAVTSRGKEPWTNLTYSVARKVAVNSSKAFEYQDSKTDLVNNYAWDTTLAWIDQTEDRYSTNINSGNYSNKVLLTGTTITDKKNNICDLAGNVKEWTTGNYKGDQYSNSYKIVRGGSAKSSQSANTYMPYQDLTFEGDRGFRMILYRE